MNVIPQLFLEQMRNTKFVSKGEVNLDRIGRSSVSELLEFAQQTTEFTSAENLEPENSPFVHTASIGMGGGRYPCANVRCRLERVEELSQFAALYSEKVFVKNIFSEHLHHLPEYVQKDESAFRRRFADDLIVVSRILPFIENGLIVPITPPNFCAHCLLGSRFGSETGKVLDAAIENLQATFQDGISASLGKDENGYYFKIDANPELLEHGRGIVIELSKAPDFIKKYPSLVGRIERGKEVELSGRNLRQSGISENLAGEVLRSVIFELAVSRSLNTSYLTERDIDVKFLMSISSHGETDLLDQDISRNLTTLLPFVASIDPINLLKLRDDDRDSFILFRKALKEAVKEHNNTSGLRLSPKDSRAIYGDIISPELARISKKLQKAQSALAREAGSAAVGWTAALSVGAFTGFITGGIVEAASALGLTRVLAMLLQKVGSASDTRSAIRDEELYFLWKVKRHAEGL